jgi:hypothetical protein
VGERGRTGGIYRRETGAERGTGVRKPLFLRSLAGFFRSER